VISSLLSSTNPIATAASPAYALRIAITVGMSAPPMGMMRRTPKERASAMIAAKATGAHAAAGCRMIPTPRATARIRRPRLVKFCPG
jgi:hypothetical protein